MVNQPENNLWRAVIARAIQDLPNNQDYNWFNSDDFADVCGLADVRENVILYIVRLIKKNPKISDKVIDLMLMKNDLIKEI
jgi:hypothetical protein